MNDDALISTPTFGRAVVIASERTITVPDVPSDVAFGEGVSYTIVFHDVSGEVTRFQSVKPHDYDLLSGTLVRIFPVGYDCPACKHGDRLSIFARHQPYIEDCPPPEPVP